MPRTTTTQKNRPGVGGDPKKRQGRPDAGARKSAKKVQELEAAAKHLSTTVLAPDRLAAMSTGELLATLEALVPRETYYLSRSLDPRPVAPQPEGSEFTIVHRHWPPGVDPLAHTHPNTPSVPQDQPPPAAQHQPPPRPAYYEERAIRAPW